MAQRKKAAAAAKKAPAEMPPGKKAPAKAPGRKAPGKKAPGRKAPPLKAPGKKEPPVQEPPKKRQERLQPYREKRDFASTPEPSGAESPAAGPEPIFVVQKHDATRLHYDLRLEVDGVLASWAVPKGPSLDPAQKRLAVRTEDHPLDYAGFEGTIPRGEYGGGTVMVWDRGTYRNLRAQKDGDGADMATALAQGLVEVELAGEKLRGRWAIVRTKGFGGKPGVENWLLIKKKDEAAEPGGDVTADRPDSVLSGRSLERIAGEEGGA